jgi:hypothetical protein
MPIILPGALLQSWSLMVNDIRPHVPGCPQPEIEDRARQAAREFCRRSYCWRSPGVTLLTTVTDQVLYSYAVPDQAELNAVHTTWDGGTELDVALPGETDDTQPDLSSSSWKVMVDSETYLRVTPPPDSSGVVVKGTVSYLPKVDATGMPSVIFDKYRLQIASGAVEMLVLQAGKPWSNPAAATFHNSKFERGISEASNSAGPVSRTPLRVKKW